MGQFLDFPCSCYTDAVFAVLQSLGKRIAPPKVLWCNYPVLFQERDTLVSKIEGDMNKLLRKWGDEDVNLANYRFWYVGVPSFKIVKRGLPHLAFEVDLFYVASDNSSSTWGKLLKDRFEVPIALLPKLVESLRKGELEPEGAEIVERAEGYTIYCLNGYDREWRLPDAFLGFLWALADKGQGWEGLFDLWSCRVLEKVSRALPSGVPGLPQPSGTEDEGQDVLAALISLGYSRKEAMGVLKKLNFPPGATLEQKITQALQHLGKE